MRYSTVRKDFEYLNSLDCRSDLVEIDAQVFDLMKDPTKKRASMMYESAIHLWFDSIKPYYGYISEEVLLDNRVKSIAKKYNIKVKEISDGK